MDDKSATKELVQLRTGRQVPDLLREMYVEKRYTDQEIADILLVSRTTVVAWRKALGIDRTDRKAALA